MCSYMAHAKPQMMFEHRVCVGEKMVCMLVCFVWVSKPQPFIEKVLQQVFTHLAAARKAIADPLCMLFVSGSCVRALQLPH